MIVYFAGVPGGPQIEREKELQTQFDLARLISFFHLKQGITTLTYYKGVKNGSDE